MSNTAAALEATGLGMPTRAGRRPSSRTAPSGCPQARVCALVGPNGAGKSTLLADWQPVCSGRPAAS